MTNKRRNTLLFILGGTLFNILTTILVFALLMFLFSRLQGFFPPNAIEYALPILVVLAMAAAFVIYRKTILFLDKKVDLEKYFEPIIKRRVPPKR
ncbi:MAG: leader peptide processing enzyme [Treponema sp.]|nr:leader peptide processing enzyme [Treponema sp.]